MKKRLTKNQQLVYDQLSQAVRPLGAYALLAKLRQHGINAPLQVYRALHDLIRLGKVHKLASINAFIACNHQEEAHLAIFTICDVCGKAEELHAQKFANNIQTIVNNTGMQITQTILELHGNCATCRYCKT